VCARICVFLSMGRGSPVVAATTAGRGPRGPPMAFQLAPFSDVGESGLSAGLLATLINEHQHHAASRLALLWSYYRNPLEAPPPGAWRPGGASGSGRSYRLGQERGLPARVTGASGNAAFRSLWGDDRAGARREVVVENDIAWRVHAMVDFLFSR